MKIRLLVLGAVLLAAGFGEGRLRAQEVTVGAPGWFKAEGAPDTPPKTRRPPAVEYPAELRERGTGETGYALVSRYLDARGRSLVLGVRSAYPWFGRAVEEGIGNWSVQPARSGGRPVAAWFWTPILFNAVDAHTDAPDAPPRLLAVTPVIVPPVLYRQLREQTTAWGTVSLDAAGVPGAVALEPGTPDQAKPYIEAALKQWRFAAARHGGQPVAAEFRAAFLLYPEADPIPSTAKPPQVIRSSQVTPVYPYAMRRYGITGEVLVNFVVDRDGRVRNPVVVRCSSPAFAEPAIVAVLQWRFEPAEVDGEKVATRMRVPILFALDGMTGHDAYAVDQMSRKAQQKLPEELRYDVAPKLRGVAEPVFPYPLLRDRQAGKATVLFVVGPDGSVRGTKVVEATRPEFGLALAAAVDTYSFTPAFRDGHPTATILRVERDFDPDDVPGLVAHDDHALLKRERSHPDSIIGADRLDAPLQPLSRQPPVFPQALRNPVDHGTARVEFLIDTDGHARLPRIVEASDPEFGYAAVQAVAQWLFEPPKAGGKAAVVRVEVPFDFVSRPPVLGTGVGTPPAAEPP
jgi:TonB family protein